MKNFFTSFFATLSALLVFCGSALVIALIALGALAAMGDKPISVPKDAYLIVDLSANIQDLHPVAELPTRAGIPGVFYISEVAEAGGLLSYGPNTRETFRSAARYVDRIARGAKPAELPIEQPDRFELVVNLRTARKLGLAIPRAVLLRADRVIE